MAYRTDGSVHYSGIKSEEILLFSSWFIGMYQPELGLIDIDIPTKLESNGFIEDVSVSKLKILSFLIVSIIFFNLISESIVIYSSFWSELFSSTFFNGILLTKDINSNSLNSLITSSLLKYPNFDLGSSKLIGTFL